MGRRHESTRDGSCVAVVVGAGPYGLATAAHLRSAGVSVRVFGEPMESWDQHMPAGMLLRSLRQASNIADPEHALGLEAFEVAAGLTAVDPVPLERFVAYGRWFQEQAVPDVDRRRVQAVSLGSARRLRIELEDGESIEADRVVVAAGIVRFPRQPAPFAGLAPELVSHTVEHKNLGIFSGKRVLVIGGGQSALESAALLHESDAQAEVLARRPQLRWLPGHTDADVGGLRYYAYRRVAVGGPRSSWVIARPDLWRRLPFKQRETHASRLIGPAGAAWLRSRVEQVRIRTDSRVSAAVAANGGLQVRLSDGETLEADHVLLATGYEVNVACYPFLVPELVARVQRQNGYPVLRPGFESSVPGLHFVGAPAALSFGPVMRFVCGTWATSRAVVRGVVGRGAPRAGFSW